MISDVSLLFVVAACVALVMLALSLWMVWTANRLDKLHLRCDAARAMLDEAAFRRSVAAQEIAMSGALGEPASTLLLSDAAASTQDADGDRWQAESGLTAALYLVDLPTTGPLAAQLTDAARRLAMARRIHNDVVASTLALRSRRRVRWFGLAGHADEPAMVAFDDRMP